MACGTKIKKRVLHLLHLLRMIKRNVVYVEEVAAGICQ